jgi:hypothetical protein
MIATWPFGPSPGAEASLHEELASPQDRADEDVGESLAEHKQGDKGLHRWLHGLRRS